MNAGKNTKRSEMATLQADAPVGKEGSVPSTEQEEEAILVPEHAAQEEERLRKEREAAAAEEAQPTTTAVLTTDRAAQLDHLLNQTDMYTKFLSEQMQSIEEKTEAEAKADAAKAGPPLKKARKGSAGAGRAGAGAGAAGGAVRGKASAASPTQELLPLVAGELRDYQLKGVKWLISLYQNGLNGILADQMGLGKTVQTIGFLSHLKSKGVHGPFLVVGPLSTLPNWVAEVERWTPSIGAVLYHGTKEERAELRSTRLGSPAARVTDAFPIVVTSYEIVLADSKFLAQYKWKYIVVDEGHRLKNMNCRLLRELRAIPTANKLLLTGTPLQNNLSELWSLLNFLLPDIFGSLADFESWFDFSAVGQEGGGKAIAAQEQRSRVVTKLHSILKPFLLRRIKTDVETSLPAKKEVLLYAQMTPVQKKLDKQLRDKTLRDAMTVAAKARTSAPVATLNNVLMQLRKNCNHPDLITGSHDGSTFLPDAADLLKQCGKMALLDRLLRKLKARGHNKVLIFSQMTRMLDLLEHFFEQTGRQTCRIDGAVAWQDRQAAMKAFNTQPEPSIFLLSTRAGGLGINLTAADTVVIFDSDFNPQVDNQAMDRCHRLGQDKPVLVFRLATANSVEGKLLKRANSKLMLERLVIKKGAFLPGTAEADSKPTSLSAEELMDILKADAPLADAPQSADISDKALDAILDREHMVNAKLAAPYALSGPGWEVVAQMDGCGLLSSVQ